MLELILWYIRECLIYGFALTLFAWIVCVFILLKESIEGKDDDQT